MKKRMTGAVMSLLILASSLAVSDSSTMGSALENEAAEHSESMFLEEDEDQNRCGGRVFGRDRIRKCSG